MTSLDDTPSVGTVTGNTYDKYGSTNPIERRIMGRFFSSFDASLPTATPATVLEVGVGEAEVSSLVAARYGGLTIVGIDLPDVALAQEWEGKPIAGSFADITALPFPSRRFDLVLAIEVLEHVDDPDAALAEISRVANADVVLSVPREPIWRVANLARGKYVRDLGNTPGHVQHWSTKAFTSLVSRHLEILEVRTPFPWTMVRARVR